MYGNHYNEIIVPGGSGWAIVGKEISRTVLEVKIAQQLAFTNNSTTPSLRHGAWSQDIIIIYL